MSIAEMQVHPFGFAQGRLWAGETPSLKDDKLSIERSLSASEKTAGPSAA